MIALALLLGVAAPVAETERAFAAAAKSDGQWTAFRRFAAPDAIMFAPRKVNARAYLAGRADPPVALAWRPAATITACDGSLAFSTGPWAGGGEAHGIFTTVWRRESDGAWRWIYDDGAAVAHRLPAMHRVRNETAGCRSGGGKRAIRPLALPNYEAQIAIGRGPAAPAAPAETVLAGGKSRDDTLRWSLTLAPSGQRVFTGWAWDGEAYHIVLTQAFGPS